MPIGISDALNAKFGMNPAGNDAAADRRVRRELLALAERDVVLAPRDQIARRVEPALEEVEAGGTIEVVPHVVFARPHELDRRPVHDARDPRRFRHVVVEDAAAEAAAGAHEVDGDVALGHAERSAR